MPRAQLADGARIGGNRIGRSGRLGGEQHFGVGVLRIVEDGLVGPVSTISPPFITQSPMSTDPVEDQLRLRRLKKRKLWLKDMIIKLESELIPDIDA